jgi:hypothetical protein
LVSFRGPRAHTVLSAVSLRGRPAGVPRFFALGSSDAADATVDLGRPYVTSIHHHSMTGWLHAAGWGGLVPRARACEKHVRGVQVRFREEGRSDGDGVARGVHICVRDTANAIVHAAAPAQRGYIHTLARVPTRSLPPMVSGRS